MAAQGSIPQQLGTRGLAAVGTRGVDDTGSISISLVLQIYLFLMFSRVTEYVEILNKVHVILIVAFLAGVISIVTGGMFRAISTKVGLLLTATTVWILLATPFSNWVGGSVAGIVSTWLKSYITFFIVAGLITSLGQFRKVVFSLASATAMIVIMVRILSFTAAADDRMQLQWGTLGNSNDLATELLLGLPFCLHIVTDRKRGLISRMFFALVSVLVLPAVLKTGSRGALLALFLLAAFLFWKASAANRMKIAAAFVVIAIATPFILTRDLRNRYLTLFMGEKLETMVGSEDDLANVRSANESTEARRQLLVNALSLSLQHPVFGVGFGQFPNADADKAIAEGKEPLWHEVHNVFAVMMVENGVPAVVFMLAAIYLAFKALLRIYNRVRKLPEQTEIARLSLCLLASMTVFFVCNNFATSAYSMQFPLLGGLAAALDTIVRRQPLAGPAAPVPISATLPHRPSKNPPALSWRF